MQFSKELHREDSKLNKAAALILRDIVSEVDPDYLARTNEENLSKFHYYENLRKEQKCQFREKLFDKINSQGTNFNPSMLKLLIQPDWILTENFHESMRDFIFFVLEIALRVASIDSEALLNIANFTLTILNDQCFDDLLPYDVMLTKYFLNKIQDSIVSSKITDIQNEMMKKPYKDLISLIPTQFYENALEFILNKFDEQVQEQHSNYKENFPTIFHEIRSYSSIKIKEGDIFEFLKMRGDSSGFIDDATNYYVSVVNQISHQQISKLDEHNFNQFDIQKFLNTNLNAIKDKANCIFQKYWESYVTNKSFENMIKQIAGQNKTFTIDEFSKRKELIFPTTVQAAREAGQQGSQVRLWKNNKFTKFTVNSNDQVYIPDISIKLKEHKYFITNGDYGFCHINYYDIVYDFDFNKMTLHVNLSAVITEKNHWSTYFWYRIPQRKHKNEHYVRELIIKIGGNFTFENGAQCITISSPSPPGGNGSYCGKTPVLKEFKLLAH